MAKESSEPKYELISEIGVVSEEGSWRLELNRISWNGNMPKYDLRKWGPERKKMGKGITLTEKELIRLCDLLLKEKQFLSEEL